MTSGDLRGARKIARKNVRLLADAVRQGYTVIATEPAAVLCLKHEYPNLLDDEDAHLVAEHSYEACEFLWGLHQEDRLDLGVCADALVASPTTSPVIFASSIPISPVPSCSR